MLDVTVATRIEEALRKSEAQYRLLFESNPQAMWVYDLATLRFLAVNCAAVRHYGYSRTEFLDMTIMDIRPPEDVKLPKITLRREVRLRSTQASGDIARKTERSSMSISRQAA